MSLPMPWVERIFEKLTLTYGRDFTSRWEGLEPAAVKRDWAEELAAYAKAPQAIAHALTVLPPDKPPTVLAFRELCSKAPQIVPPALPAPPLDPAVVAKFKALTAGICRQPLTVSWRERVVELIQSGRRLTEFQRDALKVTQPRPPAVDSGEGS